MLGISDTPRFAEEHRDVQSKICNGVLLQNKKEKHINVHQGIDIYANYSISV